MLTIWLCCSVRIECAAIGGSNRYNSRISLTHPLDDNGDETSDRVLERLEKIDDDCDKYGIQFVKIDDKKANKEYGIDKVSHSNGEEQAIILWVVDREVKVK